MSGDRALYAALLGLRHRTPSRPPPLPECAPPAGPGGRARTRNRAKDGRAPHRQPPTSLHATAWAWIHLGLRPAGCPGLLIPPADLVYLVHLLPAYRHARHYLGFAERSGLPKRLREHATSDHQGARLLRVALAAGGDFTLTRLWVGSRKLERQLKQRKATPRLLCPACPTPPRRRPGPPSRPTLLGGA